MQLERNFPVYHKLFECESELDFIPQSIFVFIEDNLQALKLSSMSIDELSSFNDLNVFLSNIYSITKIEKCYDIGYLSHIYHTLLLGYFHLSISSSGQVIPELLNILKTNENSAELKIELPLNRAFLKLTRKSRQVFEKIMHGFLDRLSVGLFGAKSKTVSFDDQGVKILIIEPLGAANEIIESIEPNRYNYIHLINLLLPKEEITLIARITKLLVRDIGFSLEEISTHLHTSKRSIQRALKQEGKSFQLLKDETRKILLRSYVNKGIHKIDELADLLAYSERSSFEKAYKKWYGSNLSKDLKNESLFTENV